MIEFNNIQSSPTIGKQKQYSPKLQEMIDNCILDNFLEAKPASKKVIFSDWSSFMDMKCMHIGKIRIELKELKDMPEDFNRFCNEHKSPLRDRIVWVRNPYAHVE